MQGVFVGGITASTHTLATESVPERFRGLAAGIIKGVGASLGVAVINLVMLGPRDRKMRLTAMSAESRPGGGAARAHSLRVPPAQT